MATVYLAQDLKHHRLVAVKVLHPELAAVLGAGRFLREIEIAARFTHPHILPLYDSGNADGYLYYVMPFVEGESLRDRLDRERQLPIPDALRITREVADALGYAHGRGVVHRDIKPENILLSGGHALVADFGIARAVDVAGGERITQTGFAIGTPAYMSPEQAAGEAVDGRSDLYGLGCVLYEMLAGEPPFTGPTAQAISARRMVETPRPVRIIRETVPESVDALLRTMLARVPADRFATASQVAAALELSPGSSPPVSTVRMPRRRVLPWVLGGAAVIAAVALTWRHFRHSPGAALDPDLIAVAPFDVLDPALGLWREGLMDQLSKDLDGAGALRTVAPSTFLGHWARRADRGSADALGRRTGAGLVVFGDLLQEGTDAVRLRASLLETGGAGPPIEVEVRGAVSALGKLADSLAIDLLAALGQRRPIAAVRQTLLGARPLPALKEYLQGEQLYRRLQYDSALVHYSRAIAADSGFALAYRRMGLVLDFGPPTEAAYESSGVYFDAASAFNHGLSARDSLLVLGDSLFKKAADGPSTQSLLFNVREETVQRYPGDPEAWLGLGEAFEHGGYPDFPPSRALEAFEHAIALDSAFAPAYEHVFQNAVRSGRPDHAVALLRTFFRLVPNTVRGGAVGPLPLVAALIDSVGNPMLAGLATTDTTDAIALFRAVLEFFGSWPDSTEMAVALQRRVAAGHFKLTSASPDWARDPVRRRGLLSVVLAGRGHLAEAYQANPRFNPTGSFGAGISPYAELALLGAVPADSAAATFDRVLAQYLVGDNWSLRRALPWWLSRGDTASLIRFAALSDTAARTSPEPYPLAFLMDAREASAYIALIRGDSASALRQLESLPDSICRIRDCSAPALVKARLLATAHRSREAADLLDHFFYHNMDPLSVLAMLERARLAETLGEKDRAVESYQFVLDTWRHADPILEKYVSEAREALGRLGEESESQ